MTSTPDPVRIATPGLIHEASADQADTSSNSPIFHEDNVERFRYYLNLFETEYARPAVLLFHQSFATNPVATVFLVVFALLIAVPVTVFLSASFFSIILVLLGAASTGIILVVVIQSVLLISLSLSVLSAVALSAIITALFYAVSWTVTTVTPSVQYTRDISLGAGAEGVAAVQSLATTVSERVPDWRDTIVNQTSQLHKQAMRIPLSQWGSQFMQLWRAIPWSRMYSITLASFRTAAAVIHTGFSIAQVVTLTIGLGFKAVHATIFCLRVLAAIFQQAFAAMQTSPTQHTDIPLQAVREDIRDGEEEVGVSTGVSSAGPSRLLNKGKGMAREPLAEMKLHDAVVADDNTGFFFVDMKGEKAD